MKKGAEQYEVEHCFMSRHCLKEWLPAIEANRKILHLKKGELLFKEGEEVKGMYFVYSGLLKVHKHWGDDKELIVRFAKQGDIVGHRGLGADTVYPVSATALKKSDICFVNLDFFNATLKVNHEFLYILMMFFAEELKISERRMRNLAHMSVKGRVAQALLVLQSKFGTTEAGEINVSLARQDLASYVGTTYETLFRVMTELTEENIIQVDGKQVLVLDKERLEFLTTVQ
jgi:CRP-like cAMP-binding protein